MSKEVVCPQCDDTYVNIARHWYGSPDCDYPDYSEHQHALIQGVLLACGSVEKGEGNASLRVTSQYKSVLEFLDSQFGVLSNGVSQKLSAKEARESLEDRGWSVSDDVSAIYEWRLRTHPELNQYHEDWYEITDGERTRKVPIYVERNPTTLLIWYLFSGRIQRNHEAPHVIFPFTSMNAELETILKLLHPFNPRVYTDTYSEGPTRKDIHLRNSVAFFEFIGEPPQPRFESKWPQDEDEMMEDEFQGDECPTCGRYYTYLSSHWDGGDECGFPPLSDTQEDVLTALLLSGATLNKTGEKKRPHVILDSTNRVFLDWVQDKLGILCAHITQRGTAEDTSDRLEDWLGVEINEGQSVYRLQTRSHPFFEEAKQNWADRLGKPDKKLTPPDSFERSPDVLRILYLHRGSRPKQGKQTYPAILISRMTVTDDALLELFEPFNPRIVNLTKNHPAMLIEDADAFYEYIGASPLGLDNLWPDE